MSPTPSRSAMPIRLSRNTLRSLLLAAALAAGASAAAAAQGGVVAFRGQVLDAGTGQPLANATVEIESLKRGTITDVLGRFYLADLPAGTYDVVVGRLGYEERTERLAIPGAPEGVTLRLAEDPVRMAAITVQMDRLERRRLRATMASRAFDESALRGVPHGTLGRFLQDVAGVRPIACTARELTPACVYARGETQRPVVVLDEHVNPGGLEALQGIPLENLYRLEVFESGAMIVAYTRFYVASAIKRDRPLHPLSAFRGRMGNAIGH
jgi:hypothetical protein